MRKGLKAIGLSVAAVIAVAIASIGFGFAPRSVDRAIARYFAAQGDDDQWVCPECGRDPTKAVRLDRPDWSTMTRYECECDCGTHWIVFDPGF